MGSRPERTWRGVVDGEPDSLVTASWSPDAGLRAQVARMLPGRDEDGVRFADHAIATYRRERLGRGTLEPWEILVAFQTDRIFRYPAARLAELHAPHERTFAYLFDWSPPLLRERLGACHGIEIPFVFGTQRHPTLRPFIGIQRSARELGRRIRDAWIAFAHTGDPSAEALGPWQTYDGDALLAMPNQCITFPLRS